MSLGGRLLLLSLCPLSVLPMRVLYWISDVVCLILHRVVGYRRTLVRRNIQACFPEKGEQERKEIEDGFYQYFCDYAFESIKLLTIGRTEIRRRMRFVGLEQLAEQTKAGRSCSVFLGHYCNWEWLSTAADWSEGEMKNGGKGEKLEIYQVYHELENKAFDELFVHMRERYGAKCVPMASTLRALVEARNDGRAVVMCYVMDQAPFWNNIHHWVDFLNHDTPVLTGAEKLARRMGHACYYAHLRRVKRGEYECRIVPIVTAPDDKSEYSATDEFYRLLEENIREQPSLWLWSHNRWKRTREEYNIRLDKETGIVDLGNIEEIKRRKGIAL